MDDQSALFRTLAAIVHRSAGGTADIHALWPIHSDPKAEIVKKWTEDELKAMTEKANAKFSQQPTKNGRIK